MKCRQLIDALEALAPRHYACEWDNPGLIVGSYEREIQKVLIALDATDEVVEQAIREQVDLILTHHPLIFRSMKQINDEGFLGRRILRIIENQMCCYAMHTNFDIAPGCMADLAAERLGLKNSVPLEPTGEADGQPIGIGKVGELSQPMSMEALIGLIKEQFHLPFVTVYGMEQVKEPVARLAVSPGAGGSMISWGVRSGASVLLTGDIGHHEGIDAAAEHMAVIDAGHYGLEHIFIEFMQQYLERQFGGQLSVVTALPAFPVKVC